MRRQSAKSPGPISAQIAQDIISDVRSQNLPSAGNFKQTDAVYVDGAIKIVVNNIDAVYAKYGEHTNVLLALETGVWAHAIEIAARRHNLLSRIIYYGIERLGNGAHSFATMKFGKY
jgi:hypothetical protein